MEILLNLYDHHRFSIIWLFLLWIPENGYQHVTANGPTELTVRQRHRAPRSEPSFPQRELDTDESTDSTLRKPTRAKSQPPASAAERTSNRDNRRSNIRHDWAERSMEARERRRLNIKGSASAGEVGTESKLSVSAYAKGWEFKIVTLSQNPDQANNI